MTVWRATGGRSVAAPCTAVADHDRAVSAPRAALTVSLCAVGFAVAAYLMLIQMKVLHHAWDPLFGSRSSAAVLHSSLSRALPVPDAALGACGYVVEAGLVTAAVWRKAPTAVASVVAAAIGTAAVVLVLVQVFIVQHLCFLCLCSAALSIAIAALAVAEAAPEITQSLSPRASHDHRPDRCR